MATIPAFEAKTKFGELLDRVLEREETVITRHERPVARLVAEGGRHLADIGRAAEGLESLQNEIGVSNKGNKSVSWKEFRSALEEVESRKGVDS